MKYYEKIDGLRFIAIFLVLIEHFAIFIGRHISAGYFGVDLFFVISGFLISTILLKDNNNSFQKNYLNFIGRRTLRIFPIYYLTILILYLLNLPVVKEEIFYLISYSYNYAWASSGYPLNPVAHFWSLAVEEQFYLFWPFIILLLKNYYKFLLFLIITIIIFGYTLMIFDILPSISKFNSVGLHTRMASLGMGALGAVLSKKNYLPVKLFKSKIFEHFMLLLLIVTLITELKLKVFLLGLCSLYLVLKSAYFEFSTQFLEKFLKHKNIIRIGTLAYGIYIFHLPIDYYFTEYIFTPIWTSIDFSSFGLFEKMR